MHTVCIDTHTYVYVYLFDPKVIPAVARLLRTCRLALAVGDSSFTLFFHHDHVSMSCTQYASIHIHLFPDEWCLSPHRRCTAHSTGAATHPSAANPCANSLKRMRMQAVSREGRASYASTRAKSACITRKLYKTKNIYNQILFNSIQLFFLYNAN